MGEFLQAHNKKGYEKISTLLLNYWAKTNSDELARRIKKYQKAYGNKYRESANELVNDTLAEIFANEKVMRDMAAWMATNESKANAKTIKQVITDYIQTIKDIIADIKNLKKQGMAYDSRLKFTDEECDKLMKAITTAMDEGIASRDRVAKSGQKTTDMTERNSIVTDLFDGDNYRPHKFSFFDTSLLDMTNNAIITIGNIQHIEDAIYDLVSNRKWQNDTEIIRTVEVDGFNVLFERNEELGVRIAAIEFADTSMQQKWRRIYEDAGNTDDFDKMFKSLENWRRRYSGDTDISEDSRRNRRNAGVPESRTTDNRKTDLQEIIADSGKQKFIKGTNRPIPKKNVNLINRWSVSAEDIKNKTAITDMSAYIISDKNEDANSDIKTVLRYSFAGLESANADLDAWQNAVTMQDQGVDETYTLIATGWFKGMDNKWRYEIPDNDMVLFKRGDRKLLEADADYRRYVELLDKIFFSDNLSYANEEYDELRELEKKGKENSYHGKEIGSLADFLKHDKLFAAYPELENITLVFTDLDSGTRGSYNPAINTIYINKELKKEERVLKSTLIHEIQHAIQRIEGFASGASKEYWLMYKDTIAENDAIEIERLQKYLERRIDAAERIGQPTSLHEWVSQSLAKVDDPLQDYSIEDHFKELDKVKRYNPIFVIEKKIAKLQRHIAQLETQSSSLLYFNTAGEIEARDVSARTDLTEEERRELFPKQNSRDIVYSGSRGVDFRRFSLSVDSEGRELSEGQKEYFKDSKIVDAEGRLKVVYHGTESEFNVFDPVKFGGKNGTQEGFGIYLSDDEEIFSMYGSEHGIKGYVNITKPALTSEKNLKLAAVKSLIKATCKNEAEALMEDGYDSIEDALKDTWISNYADTYDMSFDKACNEVAKNIINSSKSDVDTIQEIMFGQGIRDFEEAYKFYDILYAKTGIDGFVTQWTDSKTNEKSEVIVAFWSEQIKRLDNLNPTESRDVRYSIEINDETFYVNIKEDQRFFDDLITKPLDDASRTTEENHAMMHAYRNYINDKFRNKEIAVEADSFIVTNAKDLSHYTDASRSQYDATVKEAKMRASSELDNLVSASYLVNFHPYEEVKDTHPECVNGISEYITFFKVGKQFYKGTINIKNLKDRRAFYDLTKISPIPNRNLAQHIEPLSKANRALQTEMLAHYPSIVKFTRASIEVDDRYEIKLGDASPYADSISEMYVISSIFSRAKNAVRSTNINDKAVWKLGQQIYKEYKVEGLDEDAFCWDVLQFFGYLQFNDDVNYDTMMNYLLNVADEVLKHSKNLDAMSVENEAAYKRIIGGHGAVRVTDAQKKELTYYYDTWKQARNELLKAGVKISDEGSLTDDGYYSELVSEIYNETGYRMDAEATDVTQLLEIIDASKALKARPISDMHGNKKALQTIEFTALQRICKAFDENAGNRT